MAEDRTPYLARIVFPFLKNKIVCLACIHTNVTWLVKKDIIIKVLTRGLK